MFAEVLSLNQVGAEDSFFGLGGDSIMSMLVVARARRAGVLITPRQVFELRTPATLARVAGSVMETDALGSGDDVAVGPVPLTPVMRELAERAGSAARAGSQAMLVAVPAGLRLDRLTAALQTLLDQHDVLRARLDAEHEELQIPERGSGEAISAQGILRCLGVAGLDDQARREVVDTEASAAERRLDPQAGVMMQVAWFDSGPGQPGQLLLVAHHLVIDGVSWRVLIPDLATTYAALEAGLEDSVLEPAGTSFRRWASELAARAGSQAVVGELPGWTGLLTGSQPLLGDRALDPQADTMAAGLSRAPLEIPGETAAALLITVPAAFHAGIDDVLLAGLSAAVDEWLRARGQRGDDGLLVDIEGHGRIPLSGDMDLTRTVGWFTSVYPVRLAPGAIDFTEVRAGGPDAGRLVKRIKEQLRAVPGDGLGYGMLRYLNAATKPVLAVLPEAQIGFNYMGRFAAAGGDGADGQSSQGPGAEPSSWRPAGDSALRGGVDPAMPLRHALEASGSVRDLPGGPEMRLMLEAPTGLFPEPVLAGLADGWLAMLRGLVRHITETSGGGHTPSDFSLIALGQEDIEEFESAFDAGPAAG